MKETRIPTLYNIFVPNGSSTLFANPPSSLSSLTLLAQSSNVPVIYTSSAGWSLVNRSSAYIQPHLSSCRGRTSYPMSRRQGSAVSLAPERRGRLSSLVQNLPPENEATHAACRDLLFSPQRQPGLLGELAGLWRCRRVSKSELVQLTGDHAASASSLGT